METRQMTPFFSSTFSALPFQNQSPIFYCPLFSENYLNPQVRINKMVNKYTVDYHPNPSQLISRIHTLYFYGLQMGWSLFLEFFPKPIYSTLVAEKFQVYSVKTTANAFVSQKIKSLHFYSCSQAKFSLRFLSLSYRQTGIVHSFRTVLLEYIFPEERKFW